MNATITITSPVVVSVRGIDVEIDFAKAKDVNGFAQRIFDYGFRKFNDASPMGEKAPTDEAQKEAFKQRCADNARAMIADWLNGDFETERQGRVSDPLAQKAREIARALVIAKYGKLSKDATDDQKAEFNTRVANAAKLEKIVELAKAELAKAASLADLV